MISCIMNEEVPFTTAFIITTYADSLSVPQHYQQPQCSEYVSDLLITDNPEQHQNQTKQTYQLGQSLYLCVIRKKQKVYLQKISNISQHTQGWEQISKERSDKDIEGTNIFIKKSQKKPGVKYITTVSILQQQQAYKIIQQNVQSQPEHEEVKVIKFTLKNEEFYIYIERKQYVNDEEYEKIKLQLLPQSKTLFEQVANQIDITVFPTFCYPKGVEIFNKESGFKTFNFTILNNQAERVYCTSLQFRELIPQQTIQKLSAKYQFQASDNLYAHKTITIVSRYSCTDQVTYCLQHLYRIYLSKGDSEFERQVKNLATNFTLNEKTKKAHFTSSIFQIGFKVNSSFPQTSINAIYAVFKFLEVQKIVEIFQALLLEHKIFFISDCNNIVGYMVQAFQSFIYPLIWIHNIIPQLTPQLIDYTCAPMPLIVGLSNQFSQDINSTVQGLYVYVDSNEIHSTIKNPKKLKGDFRKLLLKRLKQCSAYDRFDIKDYLSNTQNMAIFKTQKQEYPNFDAYRIRNIFFELLVFLLKDYRLYFIEEPNKEQPFRNIVSIKKLYNFNALKKRHRKDQFAVEFYNTGLFEQFIETKFNEPKHKWLKTLDKAIKKIKQCYATEYIKEQSDFNETQEEGQDEQVPRGCLNMIHLFSRQSQEKQKNNFSNSSPRKSQSPKQRKSLQTTKPTNNSNFSDMQRKNSLSTNPKNSLSDDGIPQLNENNMNKVVYYIQDANDPEQYDNNLFCFYLSYPYRKAKQSTAAKWTKSQFLKLNNWRKKDNKNNATDAIKQQYQQKKEKQIATKQDGRGQKVKEPIGDDQRIYMFEGEGDVEYRPGNKKQVKIVHEISHGQTKK